MRTGSPIILPALHERVDRVIFTTGFDIHGITRAVRDMVNRTTAGARFLEANHYHEVDKCMTCIHARKFSRATTFCTCKLVDHVQFNRGCICDQHAPASQG